MRIVLDTNVLMSGIFFSGPPYRILQAWRDGRVQICISPEIFEEYLAVAERLGEQFPSVEIAPILGLLAIETELCEAGPLPAPVCDDPDDDKFLACAIAASCTCIVSGDKDLLRVSGYGNIEIVRPREFLEGRLELSD